jgi:hypothetical protein
MFIIFSYRMCVNKNYRLKSKTLSNKKTFKLLLRICSKHYRCKVQLSPSVEPINVGSLTLVQQLIQCLMLPICHLSIGNYGYESSAQHSCLLAYIHIKYLSQEDLVKRLKAARVQRNWVELQIAINVSRKERTVLYVDTEHFKPQLV